MTKRLALGVVLLGSLRLAAAEPEPAANAATVMQTIRLRVPGLASCVKKKQRGVLVATFTVNEAGVVQDLAVSGSTFTDGAVPACVKQELAAWTFAALETPADFELPLHFTQKGIALGDHGEAPRESTPKPAAPAEDAVPRTAADVARAHKNEIRACYADALRRSPSLEGRVVLGLRILATGQVAAAVVKSTTLADDAATECVAHRARAWLFPATASPMTVELPFSFSAAR